MCLLAAAHGRARSRRAVRAEARAAGPTTQPRRNCDRTMQHTATHGTGQRKPKSARPTNITAAEWKRPAGPGHPGGGPLPACASFSPGLVTVADPPSALAGRQASLARSTGKAAEGATVRYVENWEGTPKLGLSGRPLLHSAAGRREWEA